MLFCYKLTDTYQLWPDGIDGGGDRGGGGLGILMKMVCMVDNDINHTFQLVLCIKLTLCTNLFYCQVLQFNICRTNQLSFVLDFQYNFLTFHPHTAPVSMNPSCGITLMIVVDTWGEANPKETKAQLTTTAGALDMQGFD